MSPDAASSLIAEMPEDDAVRILVTMKTDEAGAILETMSKAGKPEAKAAALLTEKMRHALPAQRRRTGQTFLLMQSIDLTPPSRTSAFPPNPRACGRIRPSSSPRPNNSPT